MRQARNNPRHSARASTLVQVLAALLIGALVIGLMFLLLHVRLRLILEVGEKETACRSNLGQIAKAFMAYQEPNGDFLPAIWDGDAFRPMLSLAALYPEYVDDLSVFACPLTKDRPAISKVRIYGTEFNTFGPVSGKEKCSYFYDEISHFRDIGPSQAMVADADGQVPGKWDKTALPYSATWTRQPRKPNHSRGMNVMYFDGHVKWADTVYASDDPADNIFCPNGNWGADTDAYLWDGANARPAQAD